MRKGTRGTRIERVVGREILDSRGQPTVEAEVWLDGGAVGRAAVPAGASTGSHEAVERRDDDPTRYGGRGVLAAISAIEDEIAPELFDEDALEQEIVDGLLVELDGTRDRSRLGANAILAVSLANARAVSEAVGMPLFRALGGAMADTLPLPYLNVLNGGVHADSGLRIQEFMVVPLGYERFADALHTGVSVHRQLGRILASRGHGTAVGDEGGFAPRLRDSEEALELLIEAIEEAGFHPGREVGLALDAAASEFASAGGYRLLPGSAPLPAAAMIETYCRWVERFPALRSIEDGLAEDDWEGWAALTAALGDRVQLVGDDLFVTHQDRLARGIRMSAANAILVKPNQVGTLTETLAVVRQAQRNGFAAMLSHRSGETTDSTIADLAVATGVGQIKTGAPCRGERVSKYNQLLRIEGALGSRARMAPSPAVFRHLEDHRETSRNDGGGLSPEVAESDGPPAA